MVIFDCMTTVLYINKRCIKRIKADLQRDCTSFSRYNGRDCTSCVLYYVQSSGCQDEKEN